MSTDRFFCPSTLEPHTCLPLPAALAHHIVRVRRLEDGAALVLFDGHGGEYAATLRLEGRSAYARIQAHRAVERELGGALTLVQGMASADKMDWIVEKAVELGVQTLVPVAADRSVLKLAGARLEKRLARWESLVTAASEQCGRNRLMQVCAPRPLAQALDALQGPVLFCHPQAPATLAQALPRNARQLALVIGPEGGWSADEQARVARHGHPGVTLGPRILRTETAGLAFVAAATALLGW